jgi:FKBP-type peptidyl-prolyl cis-trans isomerase (trigger factor)
MKKIICLALVLVFALSFASCFKDDIRYDYKDMSKYVTLANYKNHVVEVEKDYLQQTIDSYIQQYATTKYVAKEGDTIYVDLKFTEHVLVSNTIDQKGSEIKDLKKENLKIENLGNGSYNKALEDLIIEWGVKFGTDTEKIITLPNDEAFGAYAGKKVYFSCTFKNMASREGDTVKVTYTGYYTDDNGNIKFNDKNEKDSFDSGKDVSFYLGSHLAIEDFEKGLIGMMAGESYKKEIKATFPEDYGNENLKGKKVIFEVQITDIMETPEYNDKFVKDHLGKETVKEFEDAVIESRAKTLLNEFLSKESKINDYPRREYKELRTQFNALDQQYKSYYGISFEDYVKAYYNMDKDEYIKESMKLEMIYYSIANAEGMIPTEDELEDAKDELIDYYKQQYMSQNSSMKEEDAVKAAADYVDQNLGTAAVYEEALFKLIENHLEDNYTVKMLDATYESITNKK